MANNLYNSLFHQPNFAQPPTYFAYSETSLQAIPSVSTPPAPQAPAAPQAPQPPRARRNARPGPSTESSSSSSSGSGRGSGRGSGGRADALAPVLPTIPERKKGAPTDDLAPYKAEIIARIRRGETGRAVARDLVARGVRTTEAALAHRRLKWGVRVRERERERAAAAAAPPLPSPDRGADGLGLGPGPDPDLAAVPLGDCRGPAPPTGWLFPQRKGQGMPSNLDEFKDEIVERTLRGESLVEVADALIAKGVQTSDRAVGRKRLLWGLRQRKSRSTRKHPPLDVVGRDRSQATAAKYCRANPDKRQIMRRLEITRMTKEGLSAQEIADQLAARGVVWKRPLGSILRLQSLWGLIAPENNPRHAPNKTAQALKAATAEQREAFRQIAKELGMENVEEWVESKMKEPVAKEARVKLAREKAGPWAPEVTYTKDGRPKKAKALVKYARAATAKQQKPARQDSDASDESSSESGSESGHDDSSSDSEEEPQLTQTFGLSITDSAAVTASNGQHSSPEVDNDTQECAAVVEMDAAEPREEPVPDNDPDSAEDVTARIFARIGQAIPKTTGPAPKPKPLYPARAVRKPPTTAGAGKSRARPRGRPNVASSAPAAARKAPAASQRTKSSPPPPIPNQDADDMGWCGGDDLGGVPSRDSTPVSSSPAAPSNSGPAQQAASQPGRQQQQQQQHKQATSTLQKTTPRRVHRAAAPPAKPAAPAPDLVIVRPEEAEANKSMLDVVAQYTAAAQLVKDTVSARTENRALPGSITGLPPSLVDVDAAKQRLKAAAHAMYTSL